MSIDSKLIQGAIWYHDKFSRPLMIRKVRVTTTANTSEIGSTSYSPPVATMFRGVFIAAVDGYEDKVFGGMRSGEGTLSVLPSQPIDEQDEIEVTVGTVTTNWRIDMRHPMHTPNAGTLYYIHCHLVRI